MSDLSTKVLQVSVNYLGPAAKIFFERQTKAHMNGLPFDSIEKQHLAELSKWVLISASLVIEQPKAKELSEKIGLL
jgi:hypothetical protein